MRLTIPTPIFICLIFCLFSLTCLQQVFGQVSSDVSKFRQLGTQLPTPNSYRSASGAPGPKYWQQRADYDMKVSIDDEKQILSGSETIVYHNNSPDVLEYIWLQLDQNLFDRNSDTYLTETNSLSEQVSFGALSFISNQAYDGGFKILEVKSVDGKPLKYTINKTMMRIDLKKPVVPKSKVSFSVRWFYNINDVLKVGGRSGYEYFASDDNYLYEMAQFFPRMAVYDDVNGWQHKQFLGRGEFALTFGNYKVGINVPSDHVVAATGVLKNSNQVLSNLMQERMKQAQTATKPVLIVSQADAEKAEKNKSKSRKTWIFEAENVRDFAFASSRKFVWDAMPAKVAGLTIMCMSFYPKEGNPLWGKYSTEVVAHTIKTYSKYTIDYDYPVAQSVHGPVWGMEYPMICFNGGRPETDGSYPERTKYAMISVIIHEVGHNFFPMIINSDERQWSWLDEGLNSFVQFLTEQEWDKNYPSTRGEPSFIVDYMKGDKSTLVPIMTNSESILQFGNNAYGKPAIGLNILRETIMGRKLFDFAFKQYCQRWAYKHPQPADLFRSLEDASAVDLDWFWQGWFYTIEPVDIAIKNVSWFNINTQNPEIEKPIAKAEKAKITRSITRQTNQKLGSSKIEQNPELTDFYNTYDPFAIGSTDKERYQNYLSGLNDDEKKLLANNQNFYSISFENLGGMIMPIILRFEFENGKDTIVRIPAEIWRYDNKNVSKIFSFNTPIRSVRLDPYLETADIDLNNNTFPRQLSPSRFQLFKAKKPVLNNPMQNRNGSPATLPK